jgi:hypothetical protein
MKHKKTITVAALAANRSNAKSSTGPRTEHGKANTSKNALQHGILAKKVVLETDEEWADFQQLLQACNDDTKPEGLLEQLFVEEFAYQIWKQRILLGLKTRELARLQGEQDEGVDGVFHGDLDLPIRASDLPIDKGWDCERLVVRAVAGTDTTSSNAFRGPGIFQIQVINAVEKSRKHNSQEVGHIEVEAVTGSTLEKITRYLSASKRDKARSLPRDRDAA